MIILAKIVQLSLNFSYIYGIIWTDKIINNIINFTEQKKE